MVFCNIALIMHSTSIQDIVTVSGDKLVPMPGTIGKRFRELGGQVRDMGKPDQVSAHAYFFPHPTRNMNRYDRIYPTDVQAMNPSQTAKEHWYAYCIALHIEFERN